MSYQDIVFENLKSALLLLAEYLKEYEDALNNR